MRVSSSQEDLRNAQGLLRRNGAITMIGVVGMICRVTLNWSSDRGVISDR
jgi:hypothetical protein